MMIGKRMKHQGFLRSDFQKSMRRKLGRVFKKQKLTDHIVSNHSKKVRDRFQYMIDHSITNRNLPDDMKTKKFSQKCPINWGEGSPTITCFQTPDDTFISNLKCKGMGEMSTLITICLAGKNIGVRRAGKNMGQRSPN